MAESTFSPSPRPLPQFYPQQQTFSTKKERKRVLTPHDHLPKPPVKSCPPLSRVFPHRNLLVSHAQVVSFKNAESSTLSPTYNEQSSDSYFEQCFESAEPIGRGSFGEVFKVHSKEDGKFYAVKKSRDRFKGKYDRSRKMEEVAKHEILPSHPNCVKFIKAWEEKGHLYIQTELCKMSVSAFSDENHNIPEAVIWNYMVDLLMAVKHLHDRNLVHMDIKPENAFVSFDGICKLGDFGLVIDLTKKSDVSNATEGDPKYLAPECLEGKFSKAADVFSLGMFILELACDLEVPRGGDAWHILRSGSLPKGILEKCSTELKEVISLMLRPDYKKRPTVDQVLSLPAVKPVLRSRIKLNAVQGLPFNKLLRRLRSTADAISPPASPIRTAITPTMSTPVSNGRQETNNSFSDDDSMNEENGERAVNPDLLNSSDEFVMPGNPVPRRAFTTPSIRRRPTTSPITYSPIKRPLFSDRPAAAQSTSSPSCSHSSPFSSPVSANKDQEMHRSLTPPPVSGLAMDLDSDVPKQGIEPKRLLSMFEAASDDEDDDM